MFQQKVNGPLNTKTILALAVATTLSFSAIYSLKAQAGSSAHPFSYEANGSCYCTEFVGISDFASTVLPTPVGGQTVTQICERLGEGPGLILKNGEYNHPAYSDAQCGHGLQSDAGGESCSILDADGTTSCGTAGSQWDLKAAYSTPAKTATTATESLAGNNATDNTTTLPALATASAGTSSSNESAPVATNNTTVNRNASQAPGNSNSVQSIANQLRAFNDAVTSNSDATPEVRETMTIVESSFRANPAAAILQQPQADDLKQPEATGYVIRDAQPENLYQSGIQIGIGNTYTMQDESPVVGPYTSNGNLTQEEILGFPELVTYPIPDKITRQTGDISVHTDNSVLEHRQIIIIEQDGSARRMTQAEIAQLPLATKEDLSTESTVQTAVIDTEKEETPEPESAAAISNPSASLSIPAAKQTSAHNWRSNLDYQYIGLAPTGYDFGGAGVEVEASASNHRGVSVIGSAGLADEYSEASLGLGFNFAPLRHRATDLVFNVGIETGQFDLGITDLEDTGGFIGGYIRTRPIGRLELTGGGRYSSYFDGDSVFIASGAFRITRQFNAFSKVEVGDNDQFSFGIRYFY